MTDHAIRKQIIEALSHQHGAVQRLLAERRNHENLPNHDARVEQLNHEIKQYEQARSILLRDRTDAELQDLNEAARVADHPEVVLILAEEMERRELDF